MNFCRGKVVSVNADYGSADWMQSMKSLEALGYRWGLPVVSVDSTAELRTGSLAFEVTVPKGFSYGVAPMIKAASIKGRDLPAFQLWFEALDNPCRD